MRLAFDATSLLGPRTGVGVVATELLRRIGQRDDLDVTAFGLTWKGRSRLDAEVPLGVGVSHRPMAARPLRFAWTHTNRPPIEWWTGSIDVVHGPNFVVPPSRRARQLVTVHDLTCMRFPELCTPDTLAYPQLIGRAITRGATIHVVSHFVADEVQELFGLSQDRIVVVPNGVNPPSPNLSDVEQEQIIARGRQLAGGHRFVLGLGTIEPRKDFPLLVQAFTALAANDADVRLVIAGPPGWGADALANEIEASPFRARIVTLGWIPDQDRTALLSAATVFAFPSKYEGFGLPPLEAMSMGTPVVSSKAGALPEVIADGGLLVAVGDVDALASAIDSVLANEILANQLRQRGFARAATYDWDTSADALVAVYHGLAGAQSEQHG